jgi:hypothetical protein
MARAPRIVVLLHEHDGDFWTSSYLLRRIASAWLDAGVEVEVLYGAERVIDADLAILHVDLTNVPPALAALAGSYPRTLNGGVRTISKRSACTHLVTRGDGWDGPVIVKTDCNFGGRPEGRFAVARRGRIARLVQALCRELPWRFVRELDPHRYPIFESVRDVPAGVWRNPALVVQRFLPERQGGGEYALRRWTFLGDREEASISFARVPIVKAQTRERCEPLPEVPDEIRAVREELGFDYGTFDFGIVGGEVVLYDVNRTPTAGAPGRIERADLAEAWQEERKVLATARRLAEGLHVHLPQLWIGEAA